MIYGQHLDIENEQNPDLDLIELDNMHYLKTGRLIESSIFLGQIGSNLSEIDSKRLNIFSANIGLAFQIKDDVLDVTGSSETLGKSSMSDKKNQAPHAIWQLAKQSGLFEEVGSFQSLRALKRL